MSMPTNKTAWLLFYRFLCCISYVRYIYTCVQRLFIAFLTRIALYRVGNFDVFPGEKFWKIIRNVKNCIQMQRSENQRTNHIYCLFNEAHRKHIISKTAYVRRTRPLRESVSASRRPTNVRYTCMTPFADYMSDADCLRGVGEGKFKCSAGGGQREHVHDAYGRAGPRPCWSTGVGGFETIFSALG